jgi:hypothetical protein
MRGIMSNNEKNITTYLTSSSQNKAFGPEDSMFSFSFLLSLASLIRAVAYKTDLFSNDSPPRLTRLPVLMFFTDAQLRSHGPIPRVLEVTRQATKPRTLV